MCAPYSLVKTNLNAIALVEFEIMQALGFNTCTLCQLTRTAVPTRDDWYVIQGWRLDPLRAHADYWIGGNRLLGRAGGSSARAAGYRLGVIV